MRAYKEFIISPIGERYNNSKKIGDKELVLNTEVYNHQFVNRKARVLDIPLLYKTPILIGDEIIVHHNVFRRWHDMKGKERNSKSFWKDNKYIITEDQIFLYKREDWKAMPNFSFIKPLLSIDDFDVESERPLIGIVKYSDGTYEKEQLVGFKPNSEYEFIIDGQRLYRVMNNFITIKYEYQGNEKEYNPSWAQSS